MHGMTISEVKTQEIRALKLRLTSKRMTVELSDGRHLSVPLDWFPRLTHASKAERENWILFGEGSSIHWPDLDEDIGVDGLLAGHPSGESKRSFNRWLKAKKEGRGLTIPELVAYEEAQKQRQPTNLD